MGLPGEDMAEKSPLSGTEDKAHAVRLDDLESDDDDDIKTTTNERLSEDVRRHDEETLTAEEEAARLLSGNVGASSDGRFGRLFRNNDDAGAAHFNVQQPRRPMWKRNGDEVQGEEGELIYKVEEGARSSSSDSSRKSSEEDRTNLLGVQQSKKRKKLQICRWCLFAVIHVIIIIAFIILLYGAFRASEHLPTITPGGYVAKTLSNGTHAFAPTTILISLDGFRADFLFRDLTPNLLEMIKHGVSPRYMTPSFPSLTFPNHFTLATGLYPESHGIVGNTFWDPNTQKEFYYTDPDRSLTPEWWNGEPIWETAELQGLHSAVHMWPGSEAHIGAIEPSYVDKFNGDEALDVKVNRILDWLDTPGPNDTNASDDYPRPQLIAAYVPNVDADGHLYGPNSTYIRSTIAEVDGMIGSLLGGLDARNLTSVVNIVVVSDHGMATTSNRRLLQYEDLIDPSLIEHTDGWPLYGLRPFNSSSEHLSELYTTLLNKSALPEFQKAFQVYLRDENMPPRYNFASNPRIAPLWLVPEPGWAIVTKDEYDISSALPQDKIYHPRGLHGYDHQHPLMRAIFIAHGPAFRQTQTPPGSVLPSFQNTEVYNIICDSLGLIPTQNNGTLRLPLKAIGQFDFSGAGNGLESDLYNTSDYDYFHDGSGKENTNDLADNFSSTDNLSTALLPPNLPSNLSSIPFETGKGDSVDDTFDLDYTGDIDDAGDKTGGTDTDISTWDWWTNEVQNFRDWASGLFTGKTPHTAANGHPEALSVWVNGQEVDNSIDDITGTHIGTEALEEHLRHGQNGRRDDGQF